MSGAVKKAAKSLSKGLRSLRDSVLGAVGLDFKQQQKKARRAAEAAEAQATQEADAEALMAKRRREQGLRASLDTQPSLFDLLGSSSKSTLG